jgi:hypothetical protein
LRTSSVNVGADKDSDKRQRNAIATFARRAVGEYYDQAVRGTDALDARPGFAAMLEHIASNGARTIIVETANRFARDLIVQETGHRMLKGKGIEIIAPTALEPSWMTRRRDLRAPGARRCCAARQSHDSRQVAWRPRAQTSGEWLVRGWFPTPRQVS